MSYELSLDPFTTDGLLVLPDLEQDPLQAWHGYQIDIEPKAGLLKLADPVDVRLQSLRTEHLKLALDEIPLLEIDVSQSSSPAPPDEQDKSKHDPSQSLVEYDNIWAHLDVQKPRRDIKLISWDHFVDTRHEPAKSAYLSEAGRLSFDALLRKIKSRSSDDSEITYAKEDIFLRALCDVALGRESAFFQWDSASNIFSRSKNGYTVSGVSMELLDQIIRKFLSQGTKYRLLSIFPTTRVHRNSISTAFTSAVQESLSAIERFVGDGLDTVPTLLRVQDIFQKPFGMVDLLYRLMETITKSADTSQVLANLFSSLDDGGPLDVELEPIIGQLMGRILQPGFNAVRAKIGLSTSDVSKLDWIVSALNEVLPHRTARLIDSTDTSLQLLRQAAPAKLSTLCFRSQVRLDFCLSWNDVSQQQEQADRYEQTSSHVLTDKGYLDSDLRMDFPTEVSISGSSGEAQAGNAFEFEFDLFAPQIPDIHPRSPPHSNSIGDVAHSILTSASPSVCWTRLPVRQALELSLLPMLTAQYRLLSYMAYESMFRDSNLLAHLQSLYRFHLMNDGPFTSRLSMSLFSSDQASSGVRQQTNTTSGLKLQSRDTWPPASSELRLVLMGILSESMLDIRDETVVEATSFAIRDLPDEELERCRDINSIYALDFLCLRYKAPSPVLESIVTTKALKRYDRIFMYLLRLLRVKDLAQHLLRRTCTRNLSEEYPPSERKFRRDMHHFTTALANYSHSIVVNTHWHQFETKMQAIQHCLNERDYSSTLGLASSLDHVRDMHEQTLNDISHALLLRKKQKEARTAIEDIFGIILRYAAADPTFHKQDNDNPITSTRNATALQHEFNDKVRRLIGYLKTISSHQSDIDQRSEMAEQLLIAIDYAGYYSKHQHKQREQPV